MAKKKAEEFEAQTETAAESPRLKRRLARKDKQDTWLERGYRVDSDQSGAEYDQVWMVKEV